MAQNLAKWTFMVYLAGDNNLESYGTKDLYETKAVGSTVDVAVVAQFDSMSDQVTRRYALTSGGDLGSDCVAELPEVNTGDPAALIDFVAWATDAYPAQHYALVLWNHGAGWKDDDIYRLARDHGVAEKLTRGQVRGISRGKGSRSLFRTTMERLIVEAAETQRAILFDDSSADFLDNQELAAVLQQITQAIGQPLDLLGFDACLMNMLEVHYQVRGLCRVAVGSQEIEPGDGWPYDAVLTRLTSEPDMAPEQLGRTIVETYVDFYRTHYPELPITQSAVRMSGIEPIAQRVDRLAGALSETLEERETLGLLFRALRATQTFTDRDYVDLVHFSELLSDTGDTGLDRVGEAARDLAEALTGTASPIIAEGHHSATVDRARGLSIYMPIRTLSPLYGLLQFAHATQWDDFLHAFIYPS